MRRRPGPGAAASSSAATRVARARCSRRRSSRGIVSAGGVAVLGGVLPTPAVALPRPGPRPRRLRVAQPAGVQRGQALRSRGPQADGRRGGGDRGADRRPRAAANGGSVEGARGRRRGLCRACRSTVSAPTSAGSGSPSTARTARTADRAGGVRAARRRGDCDRERALTATNINAGCGATDLGAVPRRFAPEVYDLGIAFDGDGDRMLAVDERARRRRRPDRRGARARARRRQVAVT